MMYHRISAAAIVAATAFAVPASAQASDYPDAVLADNPLTYLRMEEAPGGIVADSSIRGRDGVLAGTGWSLAKGPFLGAGNALVLGQAASLGASVPERSGSVEMWVNPERLGRDEEAGFVAHGDPASGGWAVGLGAKRKLTFVSGTTRTRTRVTLPFKVWSMVNVSWSGGNVTVAVNGGTTTKIAPKAGVPTSNDGGVVVGGRARGAFKHAFRGQMDEVALYDKVLTATDVREHFAAAQLPINTSPVVIEQPPVVGGNLVATPGVWSGADGEATYQWQRCDEAGDDCEDIDGANLAAYTVTAADACSTLRVIETRSNANGITTTVSDPSAVVQPCSGGDTGGGGTGGEDTGGGGTGTGTGTGTGNTGSVGTDTGGTDTGSTGTGSTGTDTSGTGSNGPDASAIGTSSGDVPASDAAGIAVAGTATDTATVRATATATSCLKLVSTRRTVKLRGLGTLRLRVAGNGCVKPGSPLRLTLAKAKGKQLKSVTYRLGGKVMRITKRRDHAAAVPSAKLRAGVQVLKVRVAPRSGKARTVTLKLRFAKA